MRVTTSLLDSEAEGCAAYILSWRLLSREQKAAQDSRSICPVREPLALMYALADKTPIDALASPLKFHLRYLSLTTSGTSDIEWIGWTSNRVRGTE